MRKNYFVSNKVAGFAFAMMMIGFTSCSETLESTSPPVPEPVPEPAPEVIETIVTITGTDPTAVTNALKDAVTDETVAAAAAKGEPIKVNIEGSGVATKAADQTIAIPQKSGATIELNFASAPTGTESNALVLKASEGADALPGDADNNLVISMPSSEGLAVTVGLPVTTVTLKTDGSGAVAYKDIIAKTAKSTIIIDKGVTIKEHELVGGNIVVKDGGAIETIAVTIKDSPSLVCLGSWWSGIWFKENGPEPQYEIRTEDGGYYVPKNVILKKSGGDYVSLETRCRVDDYIEKATVDEGLTITSLGQYKYVEGKGNNRLHTRAFVNEEGEYFADFAENTELISNFTIANEIHDVDGLYQDVANLIVNFVDSETSSKTFTFENCVFENENTQFALSAKKYKTVIHYMALEEGVDPAAPDAWMHVYDETDLNKLLEKGIPNKEVAGGESGGYWIDERLDDDTSSLEGKNLTFNLIFKNCKIGRNAIDKDKVKFPKWGLWAPEGIKFNVIIDETTYVPVTRWYGENDPGNGTIELEEPHF